MNIRGKLCFLLITIICILYLACMESNAAEYKAAIADTGFEGANQNLVNAVSRQIADAGYQVSRISAIDLCDGDRLSSSDFDLLVLPDSSTLPLKSMHSIDSFLRSGGDMMALNAPMWQTRMINANNRWLTEKEYSNESSALLPEDILFDFSNTTWTRSTNKASSRSVFESIPDGPGQGQRALHVVVDNLTGWDTYASHEIKNAFPDGNTLTIFTAKGDANTPLLSVEWAEKDDSRWIAVVHLSTEWRRYILTPKDFIYWPSTPGRGKPGDSLRPENASRLSIGLSFSHTSQLPGRHEYWVGPIGTARMSPEYEAALDNFNMPPLDGLYPAYKLFDCNEVTQLNITDNQTVTGEVKLNCPTSTLSPHPRSTGGGFDKSRSWRWIPLTKAKTASGEWRGNPVTLTANFTGDYAKSVWASFGISDTGWYNTQGALELIRKTAEKMRDGVFIADGGADNYTYFDDQTPKLGMKVINLGKDMRKVTGMIGVLDRTAPDKPVVDHTWEIGLSPGEEQTVSMDWKPNRWASSGYTVIAGVFDGLAPDKMLDVVSHGVHVWQPKKVKEFVTVKDGEFFLKGKRWRIHGVNYWPSNIIGSDDSDYASYLYSKSTYDPDVIERDLSRIKAMGLNAVSNALMLRDIDSGNLLDFLRRCENHGLKVNLHLGAYVNPLDFKWDLIKPMIERYRLWENDTVFAYDLAWELSIGDHTARKRWDADWEKWIVERYGSIENAESDWNFSVPRDENGKITNPLPDQLTGNGPWHVMVAAYRRFMDTLCYRKFDDARRLVRTVDRRHLVSFRWTESGNPTYRGDGLCFDFPYMSQGTDFLGPEGYGRIGDKEMVKPAHFEFAYARWADPSRPMVWTENGFPVWDINTTYYAPERMASQARFFQDFFDVMVDSGQNGIFYWWYPGGFRCGENSDFGIINPDGSDRPVTKVIRDNAKRFLDGPSKPVDYWITIDRDAHPDGEAGIYSKVKDEYWKAIGQGRTPGLKTSGTGTTSANCPLIAVGNTECNGTNPPKYLDGIFDKVEVRDSRGRWVPVSKDGSVTIDADKPVKVRASIRNLGEAKWINGSGTGTVCLVASTDKSKIQTVIPRPVPARSTVMMQVDALSDGIREPQTLTLTLAAKDQTDFGEKFRINLLPGN